MDERLVYQGLMGIIGYTILIIHRATLVLTFPRRYKLPVIIGAMLLALVVTTYYRRATAGIIHWMALSTFANCALMFLLFKASVFQITFAFYFNYILTISLFYLTELSVRFFISPTDRIFIPVIFSILMFLYIVFITLMVIYGKRLYQKLLVHGSKGEWALYAFGAVFAYTLMTVTRDFPGTRVHSIMVILFTVWSFFVFCFAIINAHEKTKQKYETDFARDIIASGRDHYQKMNEQFNALRILKHDYKFHLNTALSMLRKGEIEKSDEYLRGLQTALQEEDAPFYCDNPVINSLIADYARRCKESDIVLNASVSIPDGFSIPNYEMCIVLGNFLENAVEACNKLESINKRSIREIEFFIKPQGEQLAIMVRNTFDGKIASDGENVISMKKDGGIGLQSVRAVAQKYCEHFATEYDSQWFSAFVLWKKGEKNES